MSFQVPDASDKEFDMTAVRLTIRQRDLELSLLKK